jgi:3'-phosphoadenosine 5'-phosphosulfate sulfotransferase (PAPS reductase)/FAD synthetase
MMEKIHLIQKQSLPLPVKIIMSKERIRKAIVHHKGKAYISTSGGKDSLVLGHLVKQVDNSIPSVFMDTGVEWPSVRKSAISVADVVLKPKMSFSQVVDRFGYPAISKDVSQKVYEVRTTDSFDVLMGRMNGDKKGNGKLSAKWRFMIEAPFQISHKCCDVLKKNPVKSYERRNGNPVAFIGTLAEESAMRLTNYLKYGCNSFGGSRSVSRPLSFWTRKDIDEYIRIHNIDVPEIYQYMNHTGCVYCLFGCMKQNFDKIDLIRRLRPGMFKQAVKLGMLSIDRYIKDYLYERSKSGKFQ